MNEMKLVDRLRNPQTMSKFTGTADMYEELNFQRMLAADEIERLTAELDALRAEVDALRPADRSMRDVLEAIKSRLRKDDEIGAYDAVCDALDAGSHIASAGWQPIETAPNGARGYAWMMLAWGAEDDPHVAAGMRCGDKFFAAATFYCLGQEKQYEMREIEAHPTHWMPLPAAPKPEDN